jgi:hypothetical protein
MRFLMILIPAVYLSGANLPAPKPAERPFVKLFTKIGPGPLPDTSDGAIRYIGTNYGWINSHGGAWLKPDKIWQLFAGPSAGRDARGRTVGERLREINPDILITNYRNGAYSNQHGIREAMEAEQRLPLAIAVHDTSCKLAAPIMAEATSILLTPPSKVPPGKPAIYPFKASTTAAEYTVDKHKYVAWLRLDEEILRIDKAEATPEGKIRLTVVRGYWKTKGAPHGLSTPVLQPVYCGSVGPNGREYYLSGLPDGDSPLPGLRYVLMQQRPEFWAYLGDQVQGILDEGYTGAWLDCAVSSWINHSDAYGVRIAAPYDVDLKRLLDRETYREYQQRKLDYLFQRYPKGHFYVNWYFPQFYFDEGHEKYMFSGENGHHPISGGSIEMYANEHNMQWLPLMKMQLDMAKHKYTVVSWVKRSDNSDGEWGMTEEFRQFAYGTFLLVQEPQNPNYWGAAWKPDGPHGQFTAPAIVYWDLGKPLEHFDDISQAQMSGAPGIYRRRYSKGVVLVNPDFDQQRDVNLDGELYDTETGTWRSAVHLQPRTAKLLLKQ